MKGGITKMTYVTELRGADLSDSEFRVHMMLWTHSSADLSSARPTVSTLMAETGYSERTVRRSLSGLREKGFIQLDSPGGNVGGKNLAAVYTLTLPEGGGATSDTPGVPAVTGGPCQQRQGGPATGGPLSDPSSDPEPGPESDPRDTGDSAESTQSSYTIDPDGSTLSPGERNDPISPAFHHSQDRKFLLQAVKVIAQNRAEGNHENLEINLDHLLLALNTFFDRGDEYLWGSDYGWEDIPKKCVDAYEAGKWLNTYLNAWQAEEGPLEWTPYNWEAAA